MPSEQPRVLTLADLDTLTDRERDAAVAELVMGWKPVGESYSYEHGGQYFWLDERGKPTWRADAFSTDPAADYEVLVKVREEWGEKSVMLFRRYLKGPSDYVKGDYARAALRVVLEEREHG